MRRNKYIISTIIIGMEVAVAVVIRILGLQSKPRSKNK